jgi:hypothetical protein
VNYTFTISPLTLSLQIPNVGITQGTLFSIASLPLSIGLGSIGITRNRVFSVSSLQLAANISQVNFQRGSIQWNISSLACPIRFPDVSIRRIIGYEIPQVFPSTREFVPPSYPVTRSKTQNGATVKRLWASQPSGGSLTLGFTNIPDATANALAAIWDRTKGITHNVILPGRLFKGMSQSLKSHLELNGIPLAWSFKNQPTITSVAPGISNITLDFRARGYMVSAIPVVTEPDPPRPVSVSTLYLVPPSISSVGIRAKRIARLSPLALNLAINSVNMGFPSQIPLRRVIPGSLILAATVSSVRFSRGSVSMLLPMTGSNGSTIFTDAGSNAIAVARFGNTQISTAQSRWGSGSGLFDGNGDYLTAGPNAALQFGSVNFTVEMWVRFNAMSGYQALYDTLAIGGNGGRAGGFVFVVESTGKLNVFSNGAFRGASTTALAVNTWHHIALVRGNTTWSYKINGTTDATSFTHSINLTDQSFICGRAGNAADYYLNAYVQDLRATKGSALYGTTYTVPSGPLSAQL